MLLDFVFAGLDITLGDCELVLQATKMAQQQSSHVSTNCSGPKIDMLLQIKKLQLD